MHRMHPQHYLSEASQPPEEVKTCLGQLQVDNGGIEADVRGEASIIERSALG